MPYAYNRRLKAARSWVSLKKSTSKDTQCPLCFEDGQPPYN
jgi:hypothetical protein